ncbi:MAG: transcription elongation factor GreA [Pirellulales bacterium]|nr:transcription elongation factor GreA [Pirellulales bacterium]
MSDRVPMTQTGYDKLMAELKEMREEKEPELLKRVADARSEGDLSENAEYHGARESLQHLQARMAVLSDKLAKAQIMDLSKIDKSQIAFGATVVLKDLEYDDEETYTLVGAGEEDYDVGKILVTSPLAQGLLGAKVGETVEVEIPTGTAKFEVLKIDYEE